MEMVSFFTCFSFSSVTFSQFSFQQSTSLCACNRPMTQTMTHLYWLKKKKSFHRHVVSSDHVPHVPCSQARQSYGERGLPGRITIHCRGYIGRCGPRRAEGFSGSRATSGSVRESRVCCQTAGQLANGRGQLGGHDLRKFRRSRAGSKSRMSSGGSSKWSTVRR